MARIAGINVLNHQHTEIGITSVYGIGKSRAKEIITISGIDGKIKIGDLTEVQLSRIREIISKYKIEGDLRRQNAVNIKRLIDLKCYRGLRHRHGLPIHGQRTKTNARTCKGPRKPIRK